MRQKEKTPLLLKSCSHLFAKGEQFPINQQQSSPTLAYKWGWSKFQNRGWEVTFGEQEDLEKSMRILGNFGCSNQETCGNIVTLSSKLKVWSGTLG